MIVVKSCFIPWKKSAFVDCQRGGKPEVLSKSKLSDLQKWYKSRHPRDEYKSMKVSFAKIKKIFNLDNKGYKVYVSPKVHLEIDRIIVRSSLVG